VRAVRAVAQAGVEVARIEIDTTNGKISIVTGKPEPTEPNNPWLKDLDGIVKQ
jgi:hypothetical protein